MNEQERNYETTTVDINSMESSKVITAQSGKPALDTTLALLAGAIEKLAIAVTSPPLQATKPESGTVGFSNGERLTGSQCDKAAAAKLTSIILSQEQQLEIVSGELANLKKHEAAGTYALDKLSDLTDGLVTLKAGAGAEAKVKGGKVSADAGIGLDLTKLLVSAAEVPAVRELTATKGQIGVASN